MTTSAGSPLMRVLGFGSDVLAGLGLLLWVPMAILLVGIPLVLVVRLVLELVARL